MREDAFLSKEQMRVAVDQMVAVLHPQTWDRVPPAARDRVATVVHDLVVVSRAGAATPEVAALLAAAPLAPGQVPVAGTSTRTSPDQAAYWTAVAACVLELDEGNKEATGHPAAHVVPATMAAALLSTEAVSGPRFLTAVAVGYEVAARFGRATLRGPAWHTHGHWGCTGAAAAVTHLLGGTREQMAAAIDAAAGLMQVTPWATVLDGSFTRNLWMAGAVTAGLGASRLSLAGVVENLGAATDALDLVGGVDASRLDEGLADGWLVGEGYLKQHSSCSYTHGAVDLVLALREGPTWGPSDVVTVDVRTTSLCRILLGRHPRNRLAAMFSMPFVVANALVNGRVDARTMTPGSTWFERAEEASRLVDVQIDETLDRFLPARRCTEVTVHLRDGTSVALGSPNPIGDAAHFPLTRAERHEKAVRLLGSGTAEALLPHLDSLTREGTDARVALLALLGP